MGYVRNLSAEGILSLKPGLVIGEDDMGPEEVLTQLQATSVETRSLGESHTTEGGLEKVRCVAQILGVGEKAEALIADELKAATDQLQVIAERAERKQSVALLLMLAEGSPIIAGTETSGNGVLAMAGATNAFVDVNGWRPVSMEAMLKADPDHIIITDRGFGAAGGLEGLKQNVALKHTPAVKAGRVHVIDGMALLGFGPRTLATAVKISELVSSPE